MSLLDLLNSDYTVQITRKGFGYNIAMLTGNIPVEYFHPWYSDLVSIMSYGNLQQIGFEYFIPYSDISTDYCIKEIYQNKNA